MNSRADVFILKEEKNHESEKTKKRNKINLYNFNC